MPKTPLQLFDELLEKYKNETGFRISEYSSDWDEDNAEVDAECVQLREEFVDALEHVVNTVTAVYKALHG